MYKETFGFEVVRLLMHSDNAASQFKNRSTLRYLTMLLDLVKMAFWGFGCPGHGKGPWDGLAGMLKTWLRTQIKNRTLKLKNPRNVYELLKGHFDTPEWRSEHSSTTISDIKIWYIHIKPPNVNNNELGIYW